MMNVKTGVQTWATNPQGSERKTDGVERVSAAEKEKYFDNEDIGETLNKVADPNYVSKKAMRKVGNNELGKDAFMTLLLTQMKNQDPTSPLKSHEMAAQLAQFTSLEKLNNINEGIGQLRKDQIPDHNFQALNIIGKTVTMDNSKIARTDTNASHDMRFTLPADAQKAKIEIKDASGNVVRTLELRNLKTGANTISWNGKNEDGANAGTGDYAMGIEAFGSNGKKLFVQTKAEGKITGVNFTAQGPQLLMGKETLSLADVKSISDESEMMPIAPSAATGTAPAGVNVVQPIETAPANPMQPADESKNTGKKLKSQPGQSNLNDLAMTQDFINKLNKEGAKAGMEGGN